MTKRRYNELRRVYGNMSDSQLYAALDTAKRLNNKKAREHMTVIREMLMHEI